MSSVLSMKDRETDDSVHKQSKRMVRIVASLAIVEGSPVSSERSDLWQSLVLDVSFHFQFCSDFDAFPTRVKRNGGLRDRHRSIKVLHLPFCIDRVSREDHHKHRALAFSSRYIRRIDRELHYIWDRENDGFQ